MAYHGYYTKIVIFTSLVNAALSKKYLNVMKFSIQKADYRWQ